MTDGYSFVVPGPPTGKGRPRFSRKTGKAYTPAKTELAENRVLLAWQKALEDRIDDGPVMLEIEAVLERPNNHFLTGGGLSAAGWRMPCPTKAPDFDNLAKLVADALNRHAYRDDAQVVSALVVKRWAARGVSPHLCEQEHLRISIYPLAYDEAVAA